MSHGISTSGSGPVPMSDAPPWSPRRVQFFLSIDRGMVRRSFVLQDPFTTCTRFRVLSAPAIMAIPSAIVTSAWELPNRRYNGGQIDASQRMSGGPKGSRSAGQTQNGLPPGAPSGDDKVLFPQPDRSYNSFGVVLDLRFTEVTQLLSHLRQAHCRVAHNTEDTGVSSLPSTAGWS